MFDFELWAWLGILLVAGLIFIIAEIFLDLTGQRFKNWSRGKNTLEPKPQEIIRFQPEKIDTTLSNALETIQTPKSYLWWGAVYIIISLVVTMLAKEWWEYLSRAFFVIISVLFVLNSANKRITLKGDYFIYRSAWRRVHSIPYQNITRYGLKELWGIPLRARYRIYVGEKKYKLTVYSLSEFEYLRETLLEKVGPEKEKNLAVWDQK